MRSNERHGVPMNTWTEGFTTNTPHPIRRARFEMPVSVHNGETRRGTVTSLSPSGAILVMDHPPSEGALVEVEFGTPTEDTKLRLLAEVRWRESDDETTEVGIAFQNLGADGLAHLRSIVDARCA